MTLATYIAVKAAEVKLNATLTPAARRELLREVPRELLPDLKRRFAEYGPAFPVGREMVKEITALM